MLKLFKPSTICRLPKRFIFNNFQSKTGKHFVEIQNLYKNWLNSDIIHGKRLTEESLKNVHDNITAKLRSYNNQRNFYKPNVKYELSKEIIELLMMTNRFSDINDINLSNEFDKLEEDLWNSEYLHNDPMLIINIFWILIEKTKSPSIPKIEKYLNFFIDNTDIFKWEQLSTVLNVIHKNQIHKLIYRPIIDRLFQSFANYYLKELEMTTVKFEKIVEVATLLKQLEYDDEGFYFTIENYMSENLLPFNVSKTLIYLKHFTIKDDADETKKAVFGKVLDFIITKLKYFNFSQLYLLTIIYIKNEHLLPVNSLKKLYFSIFEEAHDKINDSKDYQQYINLLIMLKTRIDTAEYIKLMKVVEQGFYKNLKKLDIKVMIEFLFLCSEINYISNFYKPVFFEFCIKHIYHIDMSNLLKLNWANYYLQGNESIIKKTMEILDSNLDENLMGKLEISSSDLFPFIWLFNVRLKQKTIEKIETYIEKNIDSFQIKDIAIFLWSIVKKTKISGKTMHLILNRYVSLIEDLNPKLIKSIENNMEENIDSELDIEEVTRINTWDVMTILWGFNSIKFDENHNLITAIKTISKYLVIYYIDEFTKLELIMLIRVYLEDFPQFPEFYDKNELVFRFIFTKILDYLYLFNSNELALIIYQITFNKTLLKNYADVNSKLIEQKKIVDEQIKLN